MMAILLFSMVVPVAVLLTQDGVVLDSLHNVYKRFAAMEGLVEERTAMMLMLLMAMAVLMPAL